MVNNKFLNKIYLIRSISRPLPFIIRTVIIGESGATQQQGEWKENLPPHGYRMPCFIRNRQFEKVAGWYIGESFRHRPDDEMQRKFIKKHQHFNSTETRAKPISPWNRRQRQNYTLCTGWRRRIRDLLQTHRGQTSKENGTLTESNGSQPVYTTIVIALNHYWATQPATDFFPSPSILIACTVEVYSPDNVFI